MIDGVATSGPAIAAVIFVAGVLSGATASVVGFGIGSLMTPLLGLWFGTATAVAAVSLPHAVATALRCWRLRASIDRGVLLRFGLLSAVGGLGGALAYASLGSATLSRVLGALLLLTAIAQLTGLASRWHPKGVVVGALGLASGFFGGIAGNQGGLRAAALTAFALSPAAFVATSTATGLFVDAARAPVYLWLSGSKLVELALPIGVATVGVIIGTVLGERILFGMSRQAYARVIAVAVGLLGIWLFVLAG
jgi:uncharacterized membrane protein YfcA